MATTEAGGGGQRQGYSTGGGGSGYIGGVSNGIMENGLQSGNGKTKITLGVLHSHNDECYHHHSISAGCYRITGGHCGGGDVMWFCASCGTQQGIGNRFGTSHASGCPAYGRSDNNGCDYHSSPCNDWNYEYDTSNPICGYTEGQLICGYP